MIYDEKVQPDSFRQLVLSITELALRLLKSPEPERDHIMETIVLHMQVDVAMLEQSLCWETSLRGACPLLATYLDIGLGVPKVVPRVHITLDCRERHLHYSNSEPMQTTLRLDGPSVGNTFDTPCVSHSPGSLEVQSAL